MKTLPKAVDEIFNEQISSRETADKDYVIRCIKDLIDNPNFKTIQGKTFSSKGMTEIQVVRFLIKETDKIIFQDDKDWIGVVRNIIYDNYKETTGAKEIIEIIQHFVNWIDTEKRF